MSTINSLVWRWQTPILLIGLLAFLTAGAIFAGFEGLILSTTEMLIRLVVVIGLYLFVGNSGIISFGHVSFMAIGAYAAAWFTTEPTFKKIMLRDLPDFLREDQYPFLVAMAAAAFLPALVALFLGTAILRLSGIAMSIATFAFFMIVVSVYSNWDGVTGGVSSIIGIPTVVGPWTAFACAALAVAVAAIYQDARHGLLLRATRDDPVAASASGISLVRVRLSSFVLSAALVGLGGGLYAQFLGILTIDSFGLALTFLTIAMLVIGGMSSLTGAVTGVVVVTALTETLRWFERGAGPVTLPLGSQELGLGLIMVLVLIFRPGGLAGSYELRLGKSPKTRDPDQ